MTLTDLGKYKKIFHVKPKLQVNTAHGLIGQMYITIYYQKCATEIYIKVDPKSKDNVVHIYTGILLGHIKE